MFSRKTCQRCGKKTSKSNSFCPSCGLPFGKKQRKEELGMLGENDSFNQMDAFSNSIFGKLGGGMMNSMLNNAVKMLEKEMQREMQKGTKAQSQNNTPKTKIRLMINGKEINLGENMAQKREIEKKEKPKQTKFKTFSDEQIKKFSKLTKKEPKTDLKRIADKINYEIEIPGVESFEDISITPLENSIEIKAIGKEKAYSKSIRINLPIISYNFSKGLLVLEFQGN